MLGKLPIADLRPHHVRDLVTRLRATNSRRGTRLAPRSVRHIYAALHQVLHDAVVDEIIPSNACVLKRGELPAKIDRDPTWRPTAVFTRDEIETLISRPREPVRDARVAALRLAFLPLALAGRIGTGLTREPNHGPTEKVRVADRPDPSRAVAFTTTAETFLAGA
jgi:hypothetical protein